MNILRPFAALGLGLYLFATPFLRYSHHLHNGSAHVDHEPQHGGQLGMVGDYHIEVSRGDRVEVFVSDARRIPVKPRKGWLSFDDGEPVAMRWDSYRLTARARPAQDIEVSVHLDDGTALQTTFDFSDN